MQTIDLLVAAVGLGALAGLNLYLTVFVLSLSLRMDWLSLGAEYASLELLTHPAFFYTSLGLMLVEFFADKIPWLDSAWDVVHTFIRPLGAAFLGFTVVGDLDPFWVVIAVLISGGAGLTGHATKASGRLLLNTSPEPVSNSVASLAEDGFVLGGLGLWALSPWLGLGLVLVAMTVLFLLAYGIIRRFRRKRVEA
ncbi:MAG: DUF4126 domain-containing protein [Gammaproteobacteria bacterium]|nr:DUF4126 domain-containing protein [Gammaproteobacteria bacterium]